MIKTDPDFWDCECNNNYIHPKTEEHCKDCGAIREYMPDSHSDEIDEQKEKL